MYLHFYTQISCLKDSIFITAGKLGKEPVVTGKKLINNFPGRITSGIGPDVAYGPPYDHAGLNKYIIRSG